MNFKKPMFYNNFKLENGLLIKRFVEHVGAVEVYELTDGSFYFNFLNLNKYEVITSNSSLNIIFQTVGDKEYVGVISKSFSNTSVESITKELTIRAGLNSVAGMEQLKNILVNDVINPLKNPEKYKRFKISIPNGILLYGPPGCGKTFIVKKLAEELKYNYVELKHSDVANIYIHGTVGIIAEVFDRARAKAPSIVFIDEIEGLLPKRNGAEIGSHKREETNEFLMQLNDAGKSGVLVVGATNRPDLIDDAVMRAGRMDKRIFVPPPDLEARKKMFEISLEGRPLEENLSTEKLAYLTVNYAASDIELIVNEAARDALSMNGDYITQDILEKKIQNFPSSLSSEIINSFASFSVLERK